MSRDALEHVQPLAGCQTLEETCYQQLRHLIMSGVLHPGQPISANLLAKRFGVSRLPVIHALRRLASEGFVQLFPHKNAEVTRPSRKDIRGRYLMLAAIEDIALREAWPLSPEQISCLQHVNEGFVQALSHNQPDDHDDFLFHSTIWQACGIEFIETALQTVWNLGAYYRMLVQEAFATEFASKRMDEHAAILESIRKGDLPAASQALQDHRMRGLERVERLIESRVDLISAAAS